jgi:rubredoxin
MVLNKYYCGYCKYEFEQEVNTSGGGKHSKISSQVICPACTNFLKTWDDTYA